MYYLNDTHAVLSPPPPFLPSPPPPPPPISFPSPRPPSVVRRSSDIELGDNWRTRRSSRRRNSFVFDTGHSNPTNSGDRPSFASFGVSGPNQVIQPTRNSLDSIANLPLAPPPPLPRPNRPPPPRQASSLNNQALPPRQAPSSNNQAPPPRQAPSSNNQAPSPSQAPPSNQASSTPGQAPSANQTFSFSNQGPRRANYDDHIYEQQVVVNPYQHSNLTTAVVHGTQEAETKL